MSTEPNKPSEDNSELGITFTEVHASMNRDDEKKGPSSPSVEEIAKDTETTRQSGVFNVSEAFNAEHEMGTIVTDRRKHRHSIKEGVQSAFDQWWGNVKKLSKPAIKGLKRPEVETRVEKAETRVDVVESAATHANMAPKDDHGVVIEKIRTFKRDVEKVTGVPFTVKEAKRSEPSWTHTVSEKKIERPAVRPHTPVPPPDLRPTMVAPVVEKRIKKDLSEYQPVMPKRTEVPKVSTAPDQIAFMHIPGTVERKEAPQPARAHIAPVIQKQPVKPATETPQSVPSVPRETIGYVAREELRNKETPAKPRFEAPAPPPIGLPATSETGQDVDVNEAFRGKTGKNEERGPERIYATTPSSRSFFDPKILLASASSIVVVGVLLIIMLGGNDEPEIVVRETVTPISLVESDTLTSVPLGTDRLSFFGSLATLINTAPSGVTQFYPVIAEPSGERLASSEEFFNTFGMNLNARAVRSLDKTFMIGSVTTSRNEPFIILSSNSFDSLFAGMLEWEPLLRRDLSPLFDSSYVEEEIYDDIVIKNLPVRVLRDALGADVLFYAFTEDSVVITSSESALTVLLDEL